MRYAWLGFHILMIVLLVLAFGGAFAPNLSGSFARDAGNNVNIIIGVVVFWIVGAIVFRIIRRFPR